MIKKTIFDELDSKNYRQHDFRADKNIVLDIEQNIKNFEEIEKKRKETLKCNNRDDKTEIQRLEKEMAKEIDNFIKNLSVLFKEYSITLQNRMCAIAQKIHAPNVTLLNQVGMFRDFVLFTRVLDFLQEKKLSQENWNELHGDIDLSLDTEDCEKILQQCKNVDEKDKIQGIVKELDFIDLDLSCYDDGNVSNKMLAYNFVKSKVNDKNTEVLYRNRVPYEDDKDFFLFSPPTHTNKKALHIVWNDFHKKISDSNSSFYDTLSKGFLTKLQKQEKRLNTAMTNFFGLLKFKKYLQSVIFCESICYELENKKMHDNAVLHVYQKMELDNFLEKLMTYEDYDKGFMIIMATCYKNPALEPMYNARRTDFVSKIRQILQNKGLNSVELRKPYYVGLREKAQIIYKEDVSSYCTMHFTLKKKDDRSGLECVYKKDVHLHDKSDLVNYFPIVNHEDPLELERVYEENTRTLNHKIRECLYKLYDLPLKA